MKSDFSETPVANRTRISLFGRRNAGKSSLINALTGQSVAIVSDVPGTTTDPVSKTMEILPLGPCVVTDTAGLDDEGELGAERVKRSLAVLETTDIALVVVPCNEEPGETERRVVARCAEMKIPVILVRTKSDLAHQSPTTNHQLQRQDRRGDRRTSRKACRGGSGRQAGSPRCGLGDARRHSDLRLPD